MSIAIGDPVATSRDPVAGESHSSRPDLDRYARSDFGRSLVALLTSVVPFVALWAAMFVVQPISYWLVLLLAVPAAGFLVRTFILFHDCVHGSLLSGRQANAWVGRLLGLLVFTPFGRWRYEHVVHHATAGDLDRRGVGDVPMLTLAEYQAKRWPGRLGYRLYRNPFVMFGLGPIYSTALMQRFVTPGSRKSMRRSVWGTNAVVALVVVALCWAFGWQAFLLVEAPLVILAGGIGIWLFYVQHQYPGSYWEGTDRWSFTEAGLKGSSYLRLPRLLQFFTGNIGFHHVHHLNPKIPNYRLQRAHEEQAIFRSVPVLSLGGALRCAKLKLWDEEARCLLTWKQLRTRDLT